MKVGIKKFTGLGVVLALVCSSQSFALDIFGGVIGAAGNVLNQVTGRIGDAFAQPQDLAKEREKFFTGVDSGSVGLSISQRTVLTNTAKAQWPMIEHQLLVRNAQIAQRKSAPLIDVMEVAKAGAGSLSTSASIASVTSPGLLQSAVTSGAMDGVMSGLNNSPTKANVQHANYVPNGIGGIAGAQLNAKMNVAAATQTTVSNTISSKVKSILHLSDDSSLSHAELTDTIKPDDFDGKKPDTLHEADLYGLCGNLGWHQEKVTKKMQVYAPVVEGPSIIGAVFTLDGEGGVSGAAKFVKMGVIDFAPIVKAVQKMKGEEPRFAGNDKVSRAVWQDGTFVSVDSKNFSLGWSKAAVNLWNKAGQN